MNYFYLIENEFIVFYDVLEEPLADVHIPLKIKLIV